MNTDSNEIGNGLKPLTLRLQSFAGRIWGCRVDSNFRRADPKLQIFIQMNVGWQGVESHYVRPQGGSGLKKM